MINMPVISAFPIAEEDVWVEFDDGLLPDEYSFSQVYTEDVAITMPFYVYQSYRGKDWAALAEQSQEFETLLAQGADVLEASNKLEEMRNEYLEDYLALEEAGKLPVLYNYQLHIFLPVDAAVPELHEITLHIKDDAYTFPVGRIQFDSDSKHPESDTALTPVCFIAGWHVKFARIDGCFRENNERVLCVEKATEDISITDIYLWDDERKISDIEILITQPYDPEASISLNTDGQQDDAEIVADYLWDGKTPISLKKGERICVRFTFHEPRFANQASGYTQYHLALEYQTEDESTYNYLIWYPMAVRTFAADPHEIYLAHELGIDVLSYYEDYFTVD